MGTTPNLLLAHIVASQNQKEVTANAGFDGLDTALTDLITEAISGTTFTLPPADARAKMFFNFTGALTANNTITLPATKKLYVVLNSTTGGFSLIFKVGTGAATVTISDAKAHLIYCDGLNTVYSVGPLAAVDLSNGVTGTGLVVLATAPTLSTPTIGDATFSSLIGSAATISIKGNPSTFALWLNTNAGNNALGYNRNVSNGVIGDSTRYAFHWAALPGQVELAIYDGTGVLHTLFDFKDGLQIGTPPGGDKGAGTLNLASDAYVRRLIAANGTALAAADLALSAGWGTGATVAVAAGSTDTRGQITVTVGTAPGANPTITLTFKNGAFAAAPFALAKQEGGTQAITALTESTTLTTLVITFQGTPIAGNTVVINWMALG